MSRDGTVSQDSQSQGHRGWRILNAENRGYCEAARDILRGLGELEEGELARPQLLERVKTTDVLIVRLGHRVDRQIFAAAPQLVALVTATTGLDHVDLESAAEHGVEVLSLRGEVAFLETIAATPEHTWALLLALVRRLPAAAAHVEAGGWNRDRFRGGELFGKRLGLLGLGRVGRRVARYGRAFGMRVAAYDPDPEAWSAWERAGHAPAPHSEGAVHPAFHRAESLDQLLRDSDILSLHASLGESTQGMIGGRELELLPQGALFVNTARGDLVDEAALARLLSSGHLGGAAVDVVHHERHPEARLASPLFAYLHDTDRDNLIITPHIAGATRESMARTEIFMAQKLSAFLASRGGPSQSSP